MNKLAKRVLFITSTFPRGKNDVLANWIGKLAIELNDNNFIVEVFAPSYRGKIQKNYGGIKVHRFRYSPSFLEFLTHDEGALFKLRRNILILPLVFSYIICGSISILVLIRRNKYDILHVHWPFPQAIFALIAKLFSKSEIVLTFYGAEFTLMRKVPLANYFMRYILTKADKVSAISRFTKKIIKEVKDRDVEVIPFSSPIEVKATAYKNHENKIKQILFVGRLIERKGITYLIEAILEVLKIRTVHLNIVGQGPLYGSLSEQVKNLRVTRYISFRSSVGSTKLIDFYKNADIFVLPSIIDKLGDTEGLGVVLLEAMSFGVPVIASDVGGISDIIEDEKNGLLIKQKDPKTLANAIIKLLNDNELRNKLISGGKETIERKFSWEKIIKDTIELYKNK